MSQSGSRAWNENVNLEGGIQIPALVQKRVAAERSIEFVESLLLDAKARCIAESTKHAALSRFRNHRSPTRGACVLNLSQAARDGAFPLATTLRASQLRSFDELHGDPSLKGQGDHISTPAGRAPAGYRVRHGERRCPATTTGPRSWRSDPRFGSSIRTRCRTSRAL